jgi:hypothetical protein
MSLDTKLSQVTGLTSNRRGLLRGAGISAATLSAIAIGLPTNAQAQEASDAITDADILNFALNLEYLEAEFYQYAVYGSGLPASLTTGPNGASGGTVTGGAQVNFTTKLVKEFAEEVAQDELLHVQYLRRQLGSAAVAQPDIDIGNSFAVLGMAAGIEGTFSPYASENDFLLGGYIFEDVGVTAYHGAAALITSKAYLSAAAGILAVEAYHASEFRVQIIQNGLSHAANKISHLRAKLSTGAGSKSGDDQGTLGKGGKANVVPTDVDSIAFARTPDEVLNIVYGGGSASNYLFFPNKVNGIIQ